MIGFAMLMVILVTASVHDARCREVPDGLWLASGILGIALMTASALEVGMGWQQASMIAGSAMILADILHDRTWPGWADMLFYALATALFAVPAVVSWGDPAVMPMLAVPACYLVFLALYHAGVMVGGADVKCLVTLAMVFPVYPEFGPFPLIAVPDVLFAQVFVFPVAVLFLAALAVTALCCAGAAANMIRGCERGYAFQGRRMRIQEAREAFVWPMQDVVDGAVVRARPVDSPEAYVRLEEHGEEYVWVTPMVPFIVPITAAVAFTALVGNVLFLFI